MAFFTSSPNKRDNPSEAAQVGTVIGSGIEFKGTIKSNKDIIRIQGSFEGEIETSGDLHITDTGVVKGKIQAENVVVSGIVKGNLTAGGCLEIHKGGVVVAEAKMASVVIDEGGTFSGKSEMAIPDQAAALLQDKV